MTVTVKTVKELKELLKKIPDYAEVQHVNMEDECVQGIEINYSEGTPWSNPYVCVQ